MQTSCRFISRFLRSSNHTSSSIIVNSSYNSLYQFDFVKPQNQGFFQFSPYTTNSGLVRGSKRCVLLGFVLPTDDSNSYQHRPHFYYSYHSFFTRAKPIKKIEITDHHRYGYSKERFVWSLISAVGIFCLGSGATIVHGVQNLWIAHPPDNIKYAALVIGGSFIIEGASLVVAIQAVKKGAAAEGMKVKDYVWRGHDPTSVAVMTEDGAAVTGLAIAAASLVAVKTTGNAIYDPIGSIIVGNLLGMVAIFLIQRNRHALIGRAIDDHDMQKVLQFLKNDPVVDALYDCKSEVIGPGFFRFKAEIDFNGVVVVQNYLERTGRGEWARQFRESAKERDDSALLKIMSNYGEEVVTALGSEVDRLEKEIQELVPGIRHVDIEAHNPIDLSSSS